MSAARTPPSTPTTPLVRWLYAVAVMVVLIVLVGGITRLTESGLSITEWKPVTGAIPPLTDAQWQAEFAGYKRIPQYLEVNGPAGMTLADYKFIYFWEWLHRLLARLIGLAFALPLVWFWIRGTIPAGYKPRLLALLALGGLQGAVGWWMVSSGLSQDVKVSHYRLAVHLLVALTTLGGLVWTALDLQGPGRGRPGARLGRFTVGVLAAVAVQVLFGALVAGSRAGYVAGAGWFNLDAWPLMQGSLFPEGVDWARGGLAVLFDDPFLIHFVHRWWAWVVVGLLIVLARRLRHEGRRGNSVAIHAAFGTQIVLGIATVWSGMSLWLAAAHQLVGALLVWTVVAGAHATGQRR
ncbi:MAG TPA: COX15/CtaA family protein [Novosphingobium sp.]|nr:COX15/CtaA family protein [Novosphingobium sp.]